MSALLDRHAPVDAVFLRWIVPGGAMVRAPVVPDDDVALLPLVPVFAAGLDHVARQLFDQLVSFGALDAFEADDLAGVEVEPFASCLGMGADDRMEDRLPVAILFVQERGRLPATA